MLTEREIRALEVQDTQRNFGLGEGLTLVIQSERRSGTKSFEGRMRFPSGRKGKQVSVRLGVFEKDITLKVARKKWREIKSWSEQQNRDPRDYFQIDKNQESFSEFTLEHAINAYLDKRKSEISKYTLTNYTRQLQKVVLSYIPANTPLSELEHAKGGRNKVINMVESIEKRAPEEAKRTQRVLKQCFAYAMNRQWMSPKDVNPAIRESVQNTPRRTNHHPTITWEQVPELLDAINKNECQGHINTDLAVKMLLMTFLRVGALVRMQWDWIKDVQGIECIVIPGTVPGLKRTRYINDDLSHHVPITDEMSEVLEILRKLNGHQEYIFLSPRGKQYPHLCPDAPNNHLKRLGYKGLLHAHGWRSVALTAGQDELGVEAEVIQRQMGHLLGDKVRRAYDNSLRLPERGEFLQSWCTALVDKGLVI